MKLALPGLALAEQLYRDVEAQGYGRKGTQALLLALETSRGLIGPNVQAESPNTRSGDRRGKKGRH